MIEIIWNVSRGHWSAYEAGVIKLSHLISSADQERVGGLVQYLMNAFPDRKIVIRPKV